METTVLPNFKGGEKEYKAKMYFDGTTRVMYGTLEAGQCHFCPKGHSHSLINEGPEDLVFYATVPELG